MDARRPIDPQGLLYKRGNPSSNSSIQHSKVSRTHQAQRTPPIPSSLRCIATFCLARYLSRLRCSNNQRNHQETRAIISSSKHIQSPETTYQRSGSPTSSRSTNATSLPPLQQGGYDDYRHLEPLDEGHVDPGSFDLVAPHEEGSKQPFSLEKRSE